MSTITLYHGSTTAIEKPQCKNGRPNLDFGWGFYLTLLREQAVKWATRPVNRHNPQWLNTYEFDLDGAIAHGARYHRFDSYNDAWLDFVIDSRRGLEPWRAYDIVEGGIADDRVVNTVELYVAGFIDRTEALGRLAREQPNHQIVLLNQSIADQFLRHTGSQLLNPASETLDDDTAAEKGGTPC